MSDREFLFEDDAMKDIAGDPAPAKRPSRKTAKAASATDEPKFEEALKRLETIVDEMENGELTLDERLARFAEGVKLARLCGNKLKDAEKRVEILLKSVDGEDEWAPLELETSED